MNRLERISAILVRLQSRSVVTAQQIANQFEVSIRTVYRDIRVLEQAGIPIASNAGLGYSLAEGYKLPPLMFTTEEAIAFLMAQKLVDKHTDTENYEHFEAGMDKIRAVLRTVDKDLLESIDKNIEVINEHHNNKPKPINIFQPVLRCIVKRKEAIIEYFTNHNQQINKRTIEPIGIYFMKDSWYLLAFCLWRNDYRNFKINRIRQIIPTDNEFTHRHLPLMALLKSLYRYETMHNVVIKVQNEVIKDIGDSKYYHGWYNEEPQGDFVCQHYSTFSLHYFARWYLSFADKATIIEPIELKNIVKNIVSKIQL